MKGDNDLIEIKKIQDKVTLVILALIIVYLITSLWNAIVDFEIIPQPMVESMQGILTIFISILLDATPFILLGVILSSIIDHYVSEEFIQRILPKGKISGILSGIALGFFIPVCDCFVIPVVRRLIKKGVPAYIGVAFMLAAPIVNPVVILATFYSFEKSIPSMVLYRTGLGIIVAIVVSYILYLWTKNQDIIKESDSEAQSCCNHHHDDGHDHDDVHCHDHHEHQDNKKNNGFEAILHHAAEEFLDIFKYLMLGALCAASLQVLIPQRLLASFSENTVLSVLILMAFAYSISLCSTADSFVAKGLVGVFGTSPILGFLLLGPVLDIKNTFVLFGNYKKSFVIKLIVLIIGVVFLTVMIADKLLLSGGVF